MTLDLSSSIDFLEVFIKSYLILMTGGMILFRFSNNDKIYTMGEITDIIAPVARKYGVERIYVFGSYAKGTADKYSDVDFLIYPGQVKGLRYGELYTDLSEALEKGIDIVSNKVDDNFMDSIRNHMVLVYAA